MGATSSAIFSPGSSLSVNFGCRAQARCTSMSLGLGEPGWRCMPPTGVPALAGDGADARVLQVYEGHEVFGNVRLWKLTGQRSFVHATLDFYRINFLLRYHVGDALSQTAGLHPFNSNSSRSSRQSTILLVSPQCKANHRSTTQSVASHSPQLGR